MTSLVGMTDAQTDGVYTTFLDILMRPHIQEVNITHEPGWKYDPNDEKSVKDEMIDLTERIIAFEKGIIDPAKAPEWRETMRLMKEFSKVWRKDFLSIDGAEIYGAFARGETAHFQNGTWYLPVLKNLQDTLKKSHPNMFINQEHLFFLK